MFAFLYHQSQLRSCIPVLLLDLLCCPVTQHLSQDFARRIPRNGIGEDHAARDAFRRSDTFPHVVHDILRSGGFAFLQRDIRTRELVVIPIGGFPR